MKILFITNQFNPPRSTGSGRSSALICNELKNRGHDVDLLIFDSSSSKEDYKETNVYQYYREHNIFNVIEELSAIKDGDYDVIHQYGGGTSKDMLPLICRGFEKTKLVTTFNGPFPGCWNYIDYGKDDIMCCKFSKNIKCSIKKTPQKLKLFYPLLYFYRKIRRNYVKKYDKFFAQSEAIKTLFSKAGFNKSKFKIIPNFFDPELYTKINNSKSYISEDTIILFLGRIDRVKGVGNLIKAFKKINTDGIELRIIGDGQRKETLEKKYQNHPKINFLGFIPYKSEEFVKNYKEADIFVHPGLWPEPFNRTLLEAGISKNAMIVSDIGAPPEVLENQALIYPPNSVESLSRKLKYLINNPEKRKNLAKETHDYLIAEYSLKSAIDKIEAEYRDLKI